MALRNGSTDPLSPLKVRTDTSALALSSAGSDIVLDLELENLRSITSLFHGETYLQMRAVSGNPDILRTEVKSAVEGSSELQLLLDKYWQVRENAELSDFFVLIPITLNLGSSYRLPSSEIISIA